MLARAAAAFSIGALRRGGAQRCVGVDVSCLSLELAAAAAKKNNLQQQLLLQQADALQWLRHRARPSRPSCLDKDAAATAEAAASVAAAAEVPAGKYRLHCFSVFRFSSFVSAPHSFLSKGVGSGPLVITAGAPAAPFAAACGC